MVEPQYERVELYKRINSFKRASNPLDRVAKLHDLTSMLTPEGVERLIEAADQEDPALSRKYRDTVDWLKSEETKEEVESFAKKAALGYIQSEGPARDGKIKSVLKSALTLGALTLASAFAGCISHDDDPNKGGVDEIADSVEGPYITNLDGNQDYVGNFVKDDVLWHVYSEGPADDMDGIYKIENGTDTPVPLFEKDADTQLIGPVDMAGGYIGFEKVEISNLGLTETETMVGYNLKTGDTYNHDEVTQQGVHDDDLQFHAMIGENLVFSRRDGDPNRWIAVRDTGGNERTVVRDFDLGDVIHADANKGGDIVGIVNTDGIHIFRDVGGDEYEHTIVEGSYVKFSGDSGALITDQGVETFNMDDFDSREVIPGTQGAEEIELLEPYMAMSKNNQIYIIDDAGDMAVIYDGNIVDMWFETLKNDVLSLAGTFGDDIGQIHMTKND